MRVAVLGPEGPDTALVVASFRRRGLDADGFALPGPSNGAVGPHTEVFVPSAAPATQRLAAAFGLEASRLPASAAFRRADGTTWLRSGPLGDGRRAMPGLASLRFLSRDTLAIGVGLARLPTAPASFPGHLSLDAWLHRARLPAAFTDAFLLPVVASALLLPMEAVRSLPAAPILSLARALLDDTTLAVLPPSALAEAAHRDAGPLRPAERVVPGAPAHILTTDGATVPADAVVVVTPAPWPSEPLRDPAPTLHFTPVRVHTDGAVLAPDPRDRAAVNYRVDRRAGHVELTFAVPGRAFVTLGAAPTHGAPTHVVRRAAHAASSNDATLRVGADLHPCLPPLEALAASIDAAIDALRAPR